MERQRARERVMAAERETSETAIPIVDISEENASSVRDNVLGALSTKGFFFVRGHGVEKSLLEDGMRMAERFFGALDDAEKERYMAKKSGGEPPLGYSGRTIKLDPEVQSEPETREQYKVGVDGYAEAYMCRSSRCVASTRPPAEAFYWPEKEIAEGRLPANFKEVLCEYFEEMRKLGHRIMRVVTAAIGARYGPTFDDTGEQCAFDRPMHLLSALRYDAVSDVDAASIGCGAHTDYGCLTILQIDPEVGGLEVCVDKARADHERRWLPVEPVEGCLVVNAGGA